VSGNLTVDTDVLHVDVNNNWVGIGTTTPSGRLNVHEGDFNISNAVRGTIFVVENSSGNVGIGVAAPSASNRLEVSGRAQASNFLATGSGAVFSTNTAAADSQYLYTQNTGNVLYYGVDSSVGAFTGLANAGFIYSYNDTAFVIGTNDSERMVVLGSGNVGIGTTSPLSKLAINGGLHVGGDSDAGDNNLLVDGTGSFTGAVTASLFTKAGDCTDADAVGTSCGGGKKYATGLVSATSDGGSYNWWDATTYCRDIKNGYNDWYIPTKSELNTLYGQKTTVGGFVSGYYWSSSEYSTTSAWDQYFGNGYQYSGYAKAHAYYVRCIRRY